MKLKEAYLPTIQPAARAIEAVQSASLCQGRSFSDVGSLPPLAVTVPEALRISGIGRTKLYALIGDGQIKTKKVGRRTLVNYASLEALLS